MILLQGTVPPLEKRERDIEQLQQMLNLQEDQTLLLTNAQNSPAENPRASPLNLQMVGMSPLHSYLLTPK